MATLKELKDNGFVVFSGKTGPDGEKTYNIFKDIYDGQGYTACPFVATIEIDRNKYIFRGISCKTVEELVEQVKEYQKTLSFPGWFYDPTYNHVYTTEGMLDYYLVHNLGFSRENVIHDMSRHYSLIAGATKIRLAIDDDADKVFIRYKYGSYDMQSTINDVNDGINVINMYITMLLSETFKPYTKLINDLMTVNSKMPETAAIKSNLTDLNVYDAKESLKERLEEILKNFD